MNLANLHKRSIIVIGIIGMVPKGLERRLEESEIGGQTKIIWTTALLRLARIVSWRPKETCYHLDSSERLSVIAGVKTHKEYHSSNNHVW